MVSTTSRNDPGKVILGGGSVRWTPVGVRSGCGQKGRVRSWAALWEAVGVAPIYIVFIYRDAVGITVMESLKGMRVLGTVSRGY